LKILKHLSEALIAASGEFRDEFQMNMRDFQKVTALFTRKFVFIFKTLQVYYCSTYSASQYTNILKAST